MSPSGNFCTLDSLQKRENSAPDISCTHDDLHRRLDITPNISGMREGRSRLEDVTANNSCTRDGLPIRDGEGPNMSSNNHKWKNVLED